MYRAQRWGMAAVFSVHGVVQGTFSSRIPAVSERLGLSAALLGVALFMPAVGSLSLMPFAGRLIHRAGPRRSTQILLGAWSLALILPAIAPSLVALCVLLAVFGATAGAADIAMNAQGSVLEHRVGKSIMSGLHGMWSVGGFIGAGIGTLAAHWNIDVRAHFAALAALLLVAGHFACRPLSRAATLEPSIAEGSPGFAETEMASAEPEPPRFSLPRGPVLIIGLVAFCAVFAEVAGSDWCGVYLRDVLGSGHTLAAFGVAVFAAAMALARLSGDRIVQRFGPVTSVRAGASAGAAGAVLIVSALSPALTVVGFGLMGAGIAIVVPLAFAAAGRLGAARGHAGRGTAIAGVATVAYGAGLAAPGAIGGLAGLFSLRGSFVLITVLVTIVAVAATVLRHRSDSRPAADDKPNMLPASTG